MLSEASLQLKGHFIRQRQLPTGILIGIAVCKAAAHGAWKHGFSKNVHLLVGRTTDPFFNGGCCLGRAAGQGQRRRQLHQHIASKHQRHCHREKLADAAARPCSTATARIFLGAKPNPAIWSFIRMIPTSASLEAQTQTAIC